jgi:hypothetical protein
MPDYARDMEIGATALARLPEQFSRQPNFRGFLEAMAELVQEAEVFAGDLILGRSLDVAEGDQLDQYGELLDEPRNGLEDDDFRSVLNSKILANLSGGERETLILLGMRLANSLYVILSEAYPATVLLTLITGPEMSTLRKARVKRLLEASVSAGVRLYLSAGWGSYFSFEGDDRPGASGYDVGGWVDLI